MSFFSKHIFLSIGVTPPNDFFSVSLVTIMSYEYHLDSTLVTGLNKDHYFVCTKIELEDDSILLVGANPEQYLVFNWIKTH